MKQEVSRPSQIPTINLGRTGNNVIAFIDIKMIHVQHNINNSNCALSAILDNKSVDSIQIYYV